MHSFYINIYTGKQLSHEEFTLLTWDKTKERYEKCCGSKWNSQDDRSKVICYAIQSQDMFNLEGWRLIHEDWAQMQKRGRIL